MRCCSSHDRCDNFWDMRANYFLSRSGDLGSDLLTWVPILSLTVICSGRISQGRMSAIKLIINQDNIIMSDTHMLPSINLWF